MNPLQRKMLIGAVGSVLSGLLCGGIAVYLTAPFYFGFFFGFVLAGMVAMFVLAAHLSHPPKP